MTDELVQRAQAGEHDAFAALVDPYRRELLVHCYRLLGSLQDAEDALQEALLSAWVGIQGFEGRSSVRTWLYRVVTNRCLNVVRAAGRRPSAAGSLPARAPAPSGLGEVPWLQPFPDDLLDAVPEPEPGPEARFETREAISLAFVTAAQLLPPNQRAVLVLRDVLGYRAREVADLMGLSQDAVTSALKRARATMTGAPRAAAAPPAAGSPEERRLAELFVTAFTDRDVEALVALMKDDVWVRMPPLPFEYRGAQAARRFFTAIDVHRRGIARMVPVRANGGPAWGEYVHDSVSGALHLTGILAIGLDGDKVCDVVHFETTVGSYFGLPRMLDQ